MIIVPTFVTSLSQLIFQLKKSPSSFMLRDGADFAMNFKRFNLYKVRSIDLCHGFLGIEEIFNEKESQVEENFPPFFLHFPISRVFL